MTKNEIGREIRLKQHRVKALLDPMTDPEYARLHQLALQAKSAAFDRNIAEADRLRADIARLEAEYKKPRTEQDFPAKAVAWLKENQRHEYPQYQLTWSDAEGDWVIVTWPGHNAWAGRGESKYFETHHMLFTTRAGRGQQPMFGQGVPATGRLTAAEKSRLILWRKNNVALNLHNAAL